MYGGELTWPARGSGGWCCVMQFFLSPMLLSATPLPQNDGGCEVSPGTPFVSPLATWVECPGTRRKVNAEVRERGKAIGPELVALFQTRPELPPRIPGPRVRR